jgi:hypothetical protein
VVAAEHSVKEDFGSSGRPVLYVDVFKEINSCHSQFYWEFHNPTSKHPTFKLFNLFELQIFRF